MSYTPEVNSGRISDGSVEFVDLSPTLQAMIGALPVGAGMDFEGFSLPSGWLWEDGAPISRATYSDLLDAITIEQNGTRNGTITITGLTSTKGIPIGCAVEGTGMPSGATVASIVSSTSLTLSVAATGSGTSAIRFFPHGNGNGTTTFNTPDARGRTSVGMDDLGGNGDGGNLDSSTFGLGGEFGSQSVALTPAQTPLVSHTHSGTTGTQSVTHTHSPNTTSRSFVTAESATLVQVDVNGTSPQNVTRYLAFSSGGATTVALQLGVSHRMVVSNTGADFDTQGVQLNNANTASESSNHTHSITTGTPSVSEADGSAHQNMQPSRLVNRIVYAGV